jgi:hypothetical protein
MGRATPLDSRLNDGGYGSRDNFKHTEDSIRRELESTVSVEAPVWLISTGGCLTPRDRTGLSGADARVKRAQSAASMTDKEISGHTFSV